MPVQLHDCSPENEPLYSNDDNDDSCESESSESDSDNESFSFKMECNESVTVCDNNDGNCADILVSSDDETGGEEIDDETFMHSLGCWKTSTNTTNSATNLLLQLLRKRKHLKFLPKDSRGIVKPPDKIVMQPMAGGHYHHFGLANAIRHVLRDRAVVAGENFKLQINIDGLPIHKSTDSSLWPILGLLENTDTKPFAIGIFYGTVKPQNVDEYLQDFITDYNFITLNGLLVNKCDVTVEMCAVICDTPARAFVKRTKAHNGYAACDKCTDRGEYHAGRMTFPNLNAPLRTDDSFLRRTDQEHHKEGNPSPFVFANLGEPKDLVT